MIDRCYIEVTNVCNLSCDFCPKHTRAQRHLSADEFDLLTDKIRGKVTFLYFHLMGEPLAHPLLPDFIRMANAKGFRTVLTSNGTLLHRAPELLDALPTKIQLSLHSHESNSGGDLSIYINKVMAFATTAAERGTCIVLRLWNQGGRDTTNENIISLLSEHVPQPWHERPDGFRLANNVYLEFDRKFEWPDQSPNPLNHQNSKSPKHCKALQNQIGVLADGSVVPCCLDHNGDITLGNLLHQSLEEILLSPRATGIIDGFKHHTATEPLCQNCESALARNSFRGKKRKP